MIFTGIDLMKLRNAEFLQFSKQVINIVTLNNPLNLLVTTQLAAYQAITNEIEALFVTDQGNDTTPIIQALDARRDAAITGITLMVNAMVYHYDPAIREAAIAIRDNLRLYGGGIARQNYMAETASISNIIADWNNKPNLSAAIGLLQLESWRDELENANTNFDVQYIARTQQLGAANPATILEKRLSSTQVYYALRDRLASYHNINDGANPWGKTVNELNALIDQYNVLLANRGNEPLPPIPQQ